jgi:hypothetical protein
VREVAPSVQTVEIRPDQYVVARWSAADAAVRPMQAASSNAWTAGFGFISLMQDGREVRFRPIIETTGGLQIARDAEGFRGQVFVGLVDLRDPSAAYELPRPVALLLTGEADSVSPQQLQINHTNLPFTEVTVTARDPSDQLELRLVASGTTEQATVLLPVARPRLELSVANPVIHGFGMESVALTVRAVGAGSARGRVASLSVTRGRLDRTRVELDEQGTGTATLRSASVGRAEISASSPPFTDAAAAVRFSWPIAMLVAAIVGGVAGAVVRRARAGRMRGWGSLGPALVAGLLSGLVVVVLYGVAANVVPGFPTAAGEGLAFGLAAIGGFLGSRGSAPAAAPMPAPAPVAAPAVVAGTKKVFLSYRRDDAADVTGRIFDHLVQRFGRDRVFMDVDSVAFGADFRRQIAKALDESGVLLAIIGDDWLGPRLADPNDYVAVEIGTALERGVTVVPVLVEGAQMPREADLPPALAELAYRNAAEVRSGRDFPFHVSRLADSVATLIEDDQPTAAARTGRPA